MNVRCEHKKPIRNSSDLVNVFRAILKAGDEQDLEKEHVWVCALDTKNKIQFIDMVSMGTLTSSLVHPREVFRWAIMQNAASIVLVHNHPSGDPEPSRDDINITKRICETGKIVGIGLLDHLIISRSRWLSMLEKGYMHYA